MIDQVIVQNLLTTLKPCVDTINAAHADYVLSRRPMSERIDTAKGYLCVCQDALEFARKNDVHMYFTAYLLLTEYVVYHRMTIEESAKALRKPLLDFHNSVSSTPQFIEFYLKTAPEPHPMKSLTNCMQEFYTTVTAKQCMPTPKAVAAAGERRKSFFSRLKPTKRSEQELQYRVEMSDQAAGDEIITRLYTYYMPQSTHLKLAVDFGTIHKTTLIALRQFTYNKKIRSDAQGKKLNKKTKEMIKALLTLLWRLMQCTAVDQSTEQQSFKDAITEHTCHPIPNTPGVLAPGDKELANVGPNPLNGKAIYVKVSGDGTTPGDNNTHIEDAAPSLIALDTKTGEPEIIYTQLASLSCNSTDDNAAAQKAMAGAYENITYQNVDPAAARATRFESHGAPKPSPAPSSAPPQQCLVHLGAALHGKTDRVGVCVVHNKAIFKCCLTMHSSYKGNETNTEIWCNECNSQKYGADTVMGTKGASAYTQVRHDAQADQIRADYNSDAQAKIRAGAPPRCKIHSTFPQADKFIKVCPCKTNRPHKTPVYIYRCCVDKYNQQNSTKITADMPSLSQFLCDNCATYE